MQSQLNRVCHRKICGKGVWGMLMHSSVITGSGNVIESFSGAAVLTICCYAALF